MVRLSRYTHTFDLGDSVALYHSLRMKPVYLKKDVHEGLQAWLVGSFCTDYSDTPEELKATVDELVKYKILNHSEEDDDKVLQFVKSRIPNPAINVCYMITSEQCNLACKYCFLGNNDECKRSNFSLENMSKETADKAVDFFINQINSNNRFIHQCFQLYIVPVGESNGYESVYIPRQCHMKNLF